MLEVALPFLVREFNSYLLLRTGQEFGRAQLTRLVDDSGKTAISQDHLGLALVNVEEERSLRSQLPDTRLVNGLHVAVQPELKLNAYLLFAANFQQYDQALRTLSQLLTFFQSRPVFTAETSPGLDARIPRLSCELLSLSFEQLNQIWAFVGGKQLPSAVYKLRMVVLQDIEPVLAGPPILQVNLIEGRR